MRRSWIVVPAVVGVVAALAPLGSAGTSKSAAAPIRVTVTASEFKYVLSRPSVPAGSTVTFVVTNKGKIDHDFKIGAAKTPTLKPGKSATLTVTLKNGQAAYLCTLPGHAGAGMKGSFAVGVAPAKPAATTTAKPAATTTASSTTAPAPQPATNTGPETLLGDPAAGAAVFAANGCGGCHTLAAAGATGAIGPSLDSRKPTQGVIKSAVQSGANAGGAVMPSFNLSATDLNNLAAYVYKSTH